MVYARIADKTVADEYFVVTEKVEALYDQPRQLNATDEGTERHRLRAEMHRRMLVNGYCARPVEMDCHFESICESCTFFVTTIEFKPTLRRQRDDAHKQRPNRLREALPQPPQPPRPEHRMTSCDRKRTCRDYEANVERPRRSSRNSPYMTLSDQPPDLKVKARYPTSAARPRFRYPPWSTRQVLIRWQHEP